MRLDRVNRSVRIAVEAAIQDTIAVLITLAVAM